MKTAFLRMLILAPALIHTGCAGTQVSSPLQTNAAKVKTLRDLGYRELGFPEAGMQVGTLVLLDPAKPGAYEVMCGSKDSLAEPRFESVAGPAEWAGARALDMGVASSFLDQTLASSSLKSQASDSVVMKNIRKDLMTKQHVYNARLQDGCAAALERYFRSEDRREVGLVYEVLRADFEASSDAKVQAEGKAGTPLMSAEVSMAPSASARMLAQDMVVGYKADPAAARDVAQASGVRMSMDSPQIDRILERETRPKSERLRKRRQDTGEEAGPEWGKLPFSRRWSLAQDYGQVTPTRVFAVDRPSESAALVRSALEVQP
jgi:hypothetical protein